MGTTGLVLAISGIPIVSPRLQLLSSLGFILRSETFAVISTHFDDFRVVASSSTLQELDNAFFVQFLGYVRGQFAVSGYAFRL